MIDLRQGRSPLDKLPSMKVRGPKKPRLGTEVQDDPNKPKADLIKQGHRPVTVADLQNPNSALNKSGGSSTVSYTPTGPTVKRHANVYEQMAHDEKMRDASVASGAPPLRMGGGRTTGHTRVQGARYEGERLDMAQMTDPKGKRPAPAAAGPAQEPIQPKEEEETPRDKNGYIREKDFGEKQYRTLRKYGIPY